MRRESKAVEGLVEAKANCVTERDIELIGVGQASMVT